MRKCERKKPADTKVEGGGRGTAGAGAEVSMQPVGKIVVAQVIPLQHMEDSMLRQVDVPLKEAAACGEPTPEQASGRICDPWREAHAGAGFLAVTVAHGGPMLAQPFSEGLYPRKITCVCSSS